MFGPSVVHRTPLTLSGTMHRTLSQKIKEKMCTTFAHNCTLECSTYIHFYPKENNVDIMLCDQHYTVSAKRFQ